MFGGIYDSIRYGLRKADYYLVFYVKLMNGSERPAVTIGVNSRSDCYKILRKFRKARMCCRANSSGIINIDNFPVGSLRWIGFHSGKVRIFGDYHLGKNGITTIRFTNRCLRRINKYWN